jgi:hypothetical protein
MTETEKGNKMAVRSVLVIFFSIFLVWLCATVYFDSVSSGISTDGKCDINPSDYYLNVFQYQEILDGKVIYQHEFCPLHFMIFTILHPLKIISTQKITGSLDIAGSHFLGWIALGLWVSFMMLIGYGFILRTRPIPVYETADVMDFAHTLFKIVIKSIISSVLYIIGSAWLLAVLQQAQDGFSQMGIKIFFKNDPFNSARFVEYTFFFSVPFIICIIVIFFILRSIKMNTIVLR